MATATRTRRTEPAVKPDVAWAVEDVRCRLDALRRRRRYMDGKHDSLIPEGKTLSLALRDLLRDLSDNLCDDVVDEPVSRLEITNWTAPDEATSKAATDLWDRNRMGARADDVHRNAWGLGDGYVIVQRDKSRRARFHSQRGETMAVRYSTDQPDLLDVAAKVWKDGKRYRLNLYYPDHAQGGARLERYATRGVGAEGDLPQARSFLPMDGQDGTPEAAVDAEPDWKDTGRLPVFHFPADEVGRYGRSVLTDVIPLQDVLNKSVVDLVVAMEDVALPQRYGTGIQAETDPATGLEKPVLRRSTVGEILRTASHEARFGQFDGADLTQFLKVQESHRREIARKGYLSPASVGLAEPTATGTLVEDGRQVKRCNGAINAWGPEWAECMAYALALEQFAVDPEDLDVEWAPTETRDETALLERLVLKRDLGVPKRVLLVEAGYDEKDVTKWMDEAEQQADAIQGGRVSAPGALPPGAPAPGAGRVLPPVPGVPAGAPAPPGQ